MQYLKEIIPGVAINIFHSVTAVLHTSFTKEYIYNTCWPICAIIDGHALASSTANRDTPWTAFTWTSQTAFICTTWTAFIKNMFIWTGPCRRGTVGADICCRSVTSNKNLKLYSLLQEVWETSNTGILFEENSDLLYLSQLCLFTFWFLYSVAILGAQFVFASSWNFPITFQPSNRLHREEHTTKVKSEYQDYASYTDLENRRNGNHLTC